MENQIKKKRGRPPSTDPKGEWLHMRLSSEEEEILADYCKKHNKKRPDAVREAIQRLNDREQDYFLTAEWREKLVQFESQIDSGAVQFSMAVELMLSVLTEMKISMKKEDDTDEKI